MHMNPWNEQGLEIQTICLILAPSFLAAGIYLVLKHTAIHSGREYSRIKPEWYPWIFVAFMRAHIALTTVSLHNKMI